MGKKASFRFRAGTAHPPLAGARPRGASRADQASRTQSAEPAAFRIPVQGGGGLEVVDGKAYAPDEITNR